MGVDGAVVGWGVGGRGSPPMWAVFAAEVGGRQGEVRVGGGGGVERNQLHQ